MKKFVLMMVAGLAAAGMCACGGAKEKKADAAQPEGKAIVCYFSATGTTEAAAERIAKVADAPLHEIKPAQPYTDADLDWRDSLSRSTVEMHAREMRPELADSTMDLSAYSVIFLGYPNWWNTYPNVIASFIDANNLEGKKIVPFMTSGGGGIENSVEELRKTYPKLQFTDGLLLNNVSDEELTDWVKKSME